MTIIGHTNLSQFNPYVGGGNMPRELTYDEKMAAEAAFMGLPVNPKWSLAGLKVYTGMQKALALKAREEQRVLAQYEESPILTWPPFQGCLRKD